jgi:hypothetical protein
MFTLSLFRMGGFFLPLPVVVLVVALLSKQKAEHSAVDWGIKSGFRR